MWRYERGSGEFARGVLVPVAGPCHEVASPPASAIGGLDHGPLIMPR
jgi:hypothetical protein